MCDRKSGRFLISAGLGLRLPDKELAQSQSDPLFLLVRDRRHLRPEAWLSFVGCIRRETFKSPSIETAEQVGTD